MTTAEFKTNLVLEEHMRGKRSVPGEWVVYSRLVYDRGHEQIIVPRGFITDLASIPKLFRGLLDVNDSHRKAAVLHDFLYCLQGFTRKQCDDMFLEAMTSIGVPRYKRHLMYVAVRAGGWLIWNKRANTPPDERYDYVGPSYFNAP
jgi:hypothetical protein